MKRPVTEFEAKVYEVCRQIPPGKVATYKQIAQLLRCNGPRAVGNALRRNPFAPEVPCHRVVASDGTLGGFMGCKASKSPNLVKKREMLEAEGVLFDSRGHAVSMWKPPMSLSTSAL